MSDPLPPEPPGRTRRLRFDRHELGLVAGTAIAWGVRRGWVKTPAVGTEPARVAE